MKKLSSRKLALATAAVASAAAVALAPEAMAGAGGLEFQGIYDTLTGWTQGVLGRVIAIAMVLVGMVAGIVRQSIMALVVGISAGLGMFTAPTIIDGVLTAALPVL